MKTWKSFLKSDLVEWLLEENNPSVRYFALTDLLDKHFSNNAVKAAKAEIMKVGPVPKILSKQNVKGYWMGPDRFYSAKYKGAVW